MQIDTNTIKESTSKIGRSVTFKLIVIFILILALLIPASMVKSLIIEREARKQGVVNEISDKWGREQTVTGPIISIPYKEYFENEEGKKISVTKYWHLLPDTLDIKSHISPEVRHRGIYEAVLYNTSLIISGTFPAPQSEGMCLPSENMQWSEAFISLGITDMRGIRDNIGASFSEQEISMNPGTETNDVIDSGISAGIRFDDNVKAFAFRLSLNLNGSQEIRFTPVGKTTTVSVQSPWKDPSFSGAFLPIERTVTEKGFSAKWKVLHVNRNYPQSWKGDSQSLSCSTFGVNLFTPVDIYQKSMRTAKYALMFIVFTFMAFFISEVIKGLRVHPVQYLLIGLAIIVFYALLLSMSEHTGFGVAYLISATAVISLISSYARSILKNNVLTSMVAAILIVLYGCLYILLQLEDYALLMGSVGLFVVLALVMYMTRKIDWYSSIPEKRESEADSV
jgi:inner membrane protein